MLMFQNGLLASFIPEILMVLAYLVCLFTPGFKSQNSSIEQAQIIAEVSSYAPQQISTYKITVKDFQKDPETISESCKFPLTFVNTDTSPSFELSFSTSDGLSYVDFSRPPPTILT